MDGWYYYVLLNKKKTTLRFVKFINSYNLYKILFDSNKICIIYVFIRLI